MGKKSRVMRRRAAEAGGQPERRRRREHQRHRSVGTGTQRTVGMVTVIGGREGKADERGDKMRARQRDKENATRTDTARKGSREERERGRRGRAGGRGTTEDPMRGPTAGDVETDIKSNTEINRNGRKMWGSKAERWGEPGNLNGSSEPQRGCGGKGKMPAEMGAEREQVLRVLGPLSKIPSSRQNAQRPP